MTTCSDCLVDLVTLDELEGLDDAANVDHEVITYDMSTWPPARREALAWRLSVAELRGQIVGSSFIVARADQPLAAELLAEIDAPQPLDEALDSSWTSEDATADDGGIAGAGRRLAGFFGDLVVAGLITTATLNVGLDHDGFSRGDLRARFVVGSLVVCIYRVVCVALWGQTIGYRIARIRVVPARSRGTGSPGWKRSLTRVAVIYLPSFLPSLFPSGGARWLASAFVTIWVPVVFLAILVDEDRRGLHDRLAGCVVVCADRVAR
ncbi:MAG: hypothetical protein QOI61_1401 [Actinomycetota bacterium]|jgi:uncharacterized RDD family membrane protein YckC